MKRLKELILLFNNDALNDSKGIHNVTKKNLFRINNIIKISSSTNILNNDNKICFLSNKSAYLNVL